MTNYNGKIGIFDSGLGGLTVLSSIKKKYPKEKFLYVGDTAFLPYGSKTADTIINRTHKIVKFLISKKVKGIIVACNSASSVALKSLQAAYDIPIIGVIESSITLALKNQSIKSIGLLGTTTTVNSKAYENVLTAKTKSVTLSSIACPLFVPLVEEGWINKNTKIISTIAQEYLASLFNKNQKIESIILGCTHYPILLTQIKKAIDQLGYDANEIDFIDNGTAILEDLNHHIHINDENHYIKSNNLAVLDTEDEFYVTDSQPNFISLSSNILNSAVTMAEGYEAPDMTASELIKKAAPDFIEGAELDPPAQERSFLGKLFGTPSMDEIRYDVYSSEIMGRKGSDIMASISAPTIRSRDAAGGVETDYTGLGALDPREMLRLQSELETKYVDNIQTKIDVLKGLYEIELKNWDEESKESIAVAVCNGAVYEPKFKRN